MKRPPHARPDGTVVAPSWVGLRSNRYTYVEHYQAQAATLDEGLGLSIGVGRLTDVELYDLALDPEELRSEDSSAAYAAPRAALGGGARAAPRLRRARLRSRRQRPGAGAAALSGGHRPADPGAEPGALATVLRSRRGL